MQERCCCSKEATGTIPIMRIIDKLDSLLAKNDVEEAGRLLEYWEGEARALNDRRGLCEILSEEIGYYRSTGNSQKGLRAVDDALNLLNCIDVGDSVANATIYLNCATTMKAFGKVSEALPYYERARETYERLLPSDDFRLAGFYNNYATAMGELKRFDEARENYRKAIEILKKKGGFCELAISYVNLAQLAYDEAQERGTEYDDEAESLLDLAYKCLDDEGIERNGSYANTCRKCATAFEFFGYFMQKQELEARAQEIYKSNVN
ncbi:MAG: tetratricopeptide repeat protein [Bacteroides sp.]|nr:tetratricopeptide repeat protein [Bacillota bacterium]MCM1393959.1 tetratricopeptide repeat protein [[Eubacterium] siraeum]MCM1455132.1 tetratricopeptide repeat protein [Bacteroides sp.]